MSYFNPRTPGSFRGLYLQKKGVNLSHEKAYSLHFPLRKRFPRRRVIASGIDAQFQADLMELGKFSPYNRNYRYILLVVCVFSKYAWLIPLKHKTGLEVIKAFKTVFAERIPIYLQCDSGSEFTNKAFQQFLKENKVRFFSTRTELKASIVERLIRTFRNVIARFCTKNKTFAFVDSLQDMVYSYNHTTHSSIGIPPISVTRHNQEDIFQKIYANSAPKRQPELKINTAVRISKIRNYFEKGSAPNYQHEIYYIKQTHAGDPPMYTLRAYDHEVILGRFYRRELQPVTEPELWEVEKILKRRRRGKKTYYLVKWLHYSDSYNSWVERPEKV